MRLPLILLASLAFLSGCWSYTPARPQAEFAAEAIPAGAWPRRDVGAVRPIFDGTPRDVYAYRVVDGVDGASLSDFERKSVEKPAYVVTYRGLLADGLLRVFGPVEDEADKIQVKAGGKSRAVSFNELMLDAYLGFAPNARLISSRTLEMAAKHAALAAELKPPASKTAEGGGTGSRSAQGKSEQGKSVAAANLSVRPAATARKIEAIPLEELHLDSGVPLRFPPVRADGSKPKGLIIHLHALAGNEFEPQVVAELERRGWASIDIKTETEIDSPVPRSSYAEIRALTEEQVELSKALYPAVGPGATRKTWLKQMERAKKDPRFAHYQEVVRRLAKLRDGGFQAADEKDWPEIARTIASEVDDAVSGGAYAVQAALEYVDQERPDLQGIPVVVMGFSAGALAAPTAAARVHDRVKAVVLIGGGCDLFRVSQESVFSNGGLVILDGEEKAGKKIIDGIDKLYLEDSKLDPYKTAPLIADLPVLQVHASRDTWVPADSGELLYERLNRPARLTIWGGHEFLFYFLPGRKSWIADWVERAVGHQTPS